MVTIFRISTQKTYQITEKEYFELILSNDKDFYRVVEQSKTIAPEDEITEEEDLIGE